MATPFATPMAAELARRENEMRTGALHSVEKMRQRVRPSWSVQAPDCDSACDSLRVGRVGGAHGRTQVEQLMSSYSAEEAQDVGLVPAVLIGESLARRTESYVRLARWEALIRDPILMRFDWDVCVRLGTCNTRH